MVVVCVYAETHKAQTKKQSRASKKEEVAGSAFLGVIHFDRGNETCRHLCRPGFTSRRVPATTRTEQKDQHKGRKRVQQKIFDVQPSAGKAQGHGNSFLQFFRWGRKTKKSKGKTRGRRLLRDQQRRHGRDGDDVG